MALVADALQTEKGMEPKAEVESGQESIPPPPPNLDTLRRCYYPMRLLMPVSAGPLPPSGLEIPLYTTCYPLVLP